MKREFLIPVLVLTFLVGCNTSKQRRMECEKIAEQLITEWFDNLPNETKTHLNNYYDLIEEYGKVQPYKTYRHIEGLTSDTEEFAQQIMKDKKWIIEADQPNRYEDIRLYESLAHARIWYANDEEHLTDEENFAKMFCKKETIIKNYTSDTYISEGVNPDIYKQDLHGFLYGENGEAQNSLSLIKQLEYFIVVNTEYEYPFLKTGKESFEPGYKCSRLRIFRISDKECVLDKRIFATTADEIWTVDNIPVDELSGRTKQEVILQGIKFGLSGVAYEKDEY